MCGSGPSEGLQLLPTWCKYGLMILKRHCTVATWRRIQALKSRIYKMRSSTCLFEASELWREFSSCPKCWVQKLKGIWKFFDEAHWCTFFLSFWHCMTHTETGAEQQPWGITSLLFFPPFFGCVRLHVGCEGERVLLPLVRLAVM